LNLFRKKIHPACDYCAFAREGEDESLLCFHMGPTAPGRSCRHFRYDPLQRVPTVPSEARPAGNEQGADLSAAEEAAPPGV